MANMSYCRMENTYRDLRDVKENWDEAQSESELKFRDKILKLCNDIVDDFGEWDDDEDDDD